MKVQEKFMELEEVARIFKELPELEQAKVMGIIIGMKMLTDISSEDDKKAG